MIVLTWGHAWIASDFTLCQPSSWAQEIFSIKVIIDRNPTHTMGITKHKTKTNCFPVLMDSIAKKCSSSFTALSCLVEGLWEYSQLLVLFYLYSANIPPLPIIPTAVFYWQGSKSLTAYTKGVLPWLGRK